MNSDQYVYDQIKCICMSSNKLDKRQRRVLYVADNAMKIIHNVPNNVLNILNVVIAIRQHANDVFPPLVISQQEIQNFLEAEEIHPIPGDIIQIPLNPTPNVFNEIVETQFDWIQACIALSMVAPLAQQDAVKKAAEAFITTILCDMDGLYDLSCDFFKRIIARLIVVDEVVVHDRILAHRIRYLIKNTDIIFELKGGMAWKRFMEFFSDKREIDQIFSNGDNDTSILINPDLGDYDIVHEFLCTKIRRIMIELIPELMLRLRQFIDYAQERGLVINGHKFPLAHVNVCGFNGEIVDGNSVIVFDQERPIKVQKNELKFVLVDNYQSHFTLLRYKLPFKCLDRILCAEILDISVPHKKDCAIRSSFTDKGTMIMIDHVTVPI